MAPEADPRPETGTWPSRRSAALDWLVNETRDQPFLDNLFADLCRRVRADTGCSLMVGVGFAICSLPSPVVFGVVAALLSMLPVGGTALIWVPAAIALFVQGRWGFGIFMVIWGVLSSSIDNVVRPMLISGRAKISSLAVFIGVLGGIAAFGPLGIILGPVILSLALVLLEFTEESHG